MEKAELELVSKMPSGFSIDSEMKLSEAFAYLQRGLEDLQSRLSEEHSDEMTEFPVLNLGVMDSLERSNYSLEYGSDDLSNVVSLNFALTKPAHTRLESRYEGCDISLLSQLRNEGLKIVSSRVLGFDSSSKAVHLELTSEVPVKFRFDLNEERERIDLWIANFRSLGVRQYFVRPSQISEAFLCSLEALILGESDALMEELTLSERLVSYQQIAGLSRLDSGVGSDDVIVNNVVSFDRPLPRRDRVVKLTLNGETFEYRACAGEFSLGRGLEASLRVEALSVSRNHAFLKFKDGEFYLGDTSSNGSFVQQDGRPELFVHRGMRKLSGAGRIALGAPIDESEGKLISYCIE